MTGFVEVAPGVHVLRYPVLDVNATLVVGDGAALVVDTLSGTRQAGQLLTELRRVTDAAVVRVVNTHHHFDHCFGNATLAAGPEVQVWAHEEATRLLREEGERLRREWYLEWLSQQPELAEELAGAPLRVPDRTVHTGAALDLGGRPVQLLHLGRGHTAGDLVVLVPDAGVVVAGDLVEEGGPPMFGDGYPLEWPQTVAELLRHIGTGSVVVPGHGAVVDRGYVRAQHEELTALEWLIRDGHADGAPVDQVAANAPFGPATARVAVRRGYAELAGRA